MATKRSAAGEPKHIAVNLASQEVDDTIDKEPLLYNNSLEVKDHEVPEKEAKKICGIRVKKETSTWNIIALLIVPIVAVSAGGYINFMMPYLLRDEDYFNIPFEKVGTAAG